MSLVREMDQTPSNCFSERRTKHLIYKGLVLSIFINYLDTPCQEFSQISLKSNENKNIFIYQIQGEQTQAQTLTIPKCFPYFYNERERE